MLLEHVADAPVAERREPASQATAWHPDQLPWAWAPASSAMRIPSPVLCRVPRTRASSQPGPRYRVRHSGIRLEPPRGEDDRSGGDLEEAVRPAAGHAADPAAAVQEEPGRRVP